MLYKINTICILIEVDWASYIKKSKPVINSFIYLKKKYQISSTLAKKKIWT